MLATGSICKHIEKYYLSTVGDPIFFWKIEEEWFQQVPGFANASLDHTLSETGDSCHRDIINTQQSVPTKPGEEKRNQYNLFADKFCQPPNLFVCVDSEHEPINADQYRELEKYFNK